MGNNAPELDQKRSIDIITSAINDTRARMEVNTGAHMLLWGYTLTLTAAAAAIATLRAATPATTMIWIAVPVAGIIGTWILSRRKPSDYPSNRILKALWWVVGIIAAVIFTLTAHFFTVALLLAVAAIVTGIITREKAVVAAGVAAALAATLFPIYKYLHPTAALFGTEDAAPAIRVASYEAWFALTAAIMFIIPGHILHSRKSALTGNNNPQKKSHQ